MLKQQPLGSPVSYVESADQRRSERKNVIKSAVVRPVLEETGFPIVNISHRGVSGRSTAQLSVRQCVHITLNGRRYLAAEVRWASGDQYGLELEEPLFCLPGTEPMAPSQHGRNARSPRIQVALPATLVVTAPPIAARVKNVSDGGLMIDIDHAVSEGERLLVTVKNAQSMLTRVQWTDNGFAGLRILEPDEEVPEDSQWT